MSDLHNPYTYEPIDRTSVNDSHYVQAEDWQDVNGHRTHIAVAIESYAGDESVTLIIASAAEARNLKNLFAKVERRMS